MPAVGTPIFASWQEAAGSQEIEEDRWIGLSPKWLFRGSDPKHSTSKQVPR
jgi:hypothetical protein